MKSTQNLVIQRGSEIFVSCRVVAVEQKQPPTQRGIPPSFFFTGEKKVTQHFIYSS